MSNTFWIVSICLSVFVTISIVFIVLYATKSTQQNMLETDINQDQSQLLPVKFLKNDTKLVANSTIKPIIYFHICLTGRWKDVVKRMWLNIKESKLYQAVDKIYIAVLGPVDQFNILQGIIEDDKCHIRIHEGSTKTYERTTLNLIYDDVMLNTLNYPILYIHSKGIGKTNKDKIRKVDEWTDYMLHFLVDRYENCLHMLQYGDTCGVNFQFKPKRHYSGNFWWANSQHIRTLPRKIGDDYFDPEMWLCSNDPLSVNLYDSGVNHYFSSYSEDKYKEKTIEPFATKSLLSLSF